MPNAKNPAVTFKDQSNQGIRPLRKPILSRLLEQHRNATIMIMAIIIVGLVIMLGTVLYVQGQLKTIENAPANVISGPILGSLSLEQHGILTYNYSTYLVGYSKVHYVQANATNASISLSIYPSNPTEPIYLVNVEGYCIQCFIGSSLYGALNTSMHTYGLILNRSSLNYIDINKLSSLPKNVVVVIPSGLIPNILLPNVSYTERCTNYANVSIVSMLNDGDTIIYVGRNFTRSVSCSGQIAQNTNQEISTLLPYSNYTSENLTNASLFFTRPTFFLEPGKSFGKVTSAHILNGTLVAMSNYPSVGWNNSVGNLASDISKVIESRFWMDPIAYGALNLTNSKSMNVTLFTTSSQISYSPTASQQINSSYALIRLNLSNAKNYQEFEMPFKYTLRQNGLISLPPVVGLSQNTQISTQIFNSTNNRTAITFVPILNSNLTEATNNPVHIGQTGATAIFTFAPFYLPSGYYIAQLVDQYGSIYSSALFYVANSVVTPTNLDFKNVTFSFAVASNRQPVNGVDYQISINNAYNSSGVINNGVIHYTLPQGTSLSVGSGYFILEMMGRTYTIPYQYQNQNNVQIPPLYIAFAIAAVAIVILNKVLVPPNIDEYYIDVPDIKPAKLEHAKESSDSILSVFDKTNAFYRWNHMPLTAEEVKAGITTNIKYGTTRMSITLRNTYAILNGLVEKGLVQMADDYYAPTKWIRDYGYSMAYLVVYRKLKDYCISNAMLMTEMGTSSKADVIVTNKGAQNYVKIYSSDMKIKDIEINQKIRTFIVFLDEESRFEFMDKLYKSYSNNAEILKMAINYGNVKLVDSNNLGELKL